MPTSESLNRKNIHENFYQESIERYSPFDVRSMKWNSITSQESRFQSLIRIGDLNQKSVLDIGCGTGDFVNFFFRKKIQLSDYLGIEIIEDFYKVAKERYSNYSFLLTDYFSFRFSKKFDFAFCNGALNVREKDNMKLLEKFIHKTLNNVNQGIGITLLKYAPGYFKESRLYHYRPGKVKLLLKRLNLSHEIISDYADNDFTVFIRKDNK